MTRRILGRDKIIKEVAESLSNKNIETPLDKGLQEGIKEYVKKEIEAKQKLENILSVGDEPLFSCKNMFPFDLFPDEIIIDFNKVSYAAHHFFSHTFDVTHSISLEDVGDVLVSSAIFFAKIEVTDKSDANNSIKVSFMKIRDAVKARRIIQGLVTAKKQGIDLAALADYNREDLVSRIEKLGEMAG